MSFLNRKKKSASTDSTDQPTPKRSKRRRGHTRRRQHSILAKMKISESVSATIVDAIHGDPSVINTDKDFVKAQALDFNGQTYYPVLILDDASLHDCGLEKRENKNSYGQLSVGLKTSSGASGFLPIATSDSLSQHFIGLLPMHDAFEVLKGYPIFENYRPGFLVGLVNIDDDEVTLHKTDVPLNMDQWWSFVTGKAKFVVTNPDEFTVRLSEGADSAADVFAVDKNESGEGTSPAQTAKQSIVAASREFDDDSPDGSSAASRFVSDNSGGTSQADGDPSDGFSVDEFDEPEDDPAPKSDAAQKPTTNEFPTTDEVVSDAPKDSQAPAQSADKPTVTTPDTSEAPSASATPVDTPATDDKSDGDDVANLTSPDELKAASLQLGHSVLSLDDFNVTVSNKEFEESFIKPLDVELLPMLDESAQGDPTGKNKAENKLRQTINAELTSECNARRARLTQWFENQRYNLLDAIRADAAKTDSTLGQNTKTMKELQDALNDTEGLRNYAQQQLSEKLTQLNQDFENQKEAARQQALAEVEMRFSEKHETLNQQREDLVSAGVASRSKELSQQILQIKQANQDEAQKSAATVYGEIMQQGSQEFAKTQTYLSNTHKRLVDQLTAHLRKSRQEENRRVENDAEIARHDATAATLREQLAQQRADSESALKTQADDYQQQLAEASKAADDQRDQLKRQHNADITKLESERDDVKSQLANAQKLNKEQLNDEATRHQADVDRLVKQSQDSENRFDRDRRRIRAGYIGVCLILALLGLLAGFSGGLLTHSNTHSQDQSTTRTVAIPYQVPQASSSVASSSSSSQASSSSSQQSSNKSSSSSSKANSTKTSDAHK